MAEDYYKTLGVKRDATQADLEKAYRALAKKYHPDLNPDDKTAKKKFQAVQAAFDVLNDPKKRELYDRYGSSFEDVARAKAQGGGAGPGGFHPGQMPPGAEDIDFSQLFGGQFGGGQGGFADIFSQFRGGGSGRRRRQAGASRGQDVESSIEIPFNLAVTGGHTQLSISRDGEHTETLEVKIPAGIDDGKKIRLRGQGQPAPEGGTPGDLLILVHVSPHPWFTRKGDDLFVKLPITLGEALQGGKVDVPTPKGTVAITVPANTSSGKRLRIKGRGVEPKGRPAGDLYAEVQIVLPEGLDAATIETIRAAETKQPLHPRDQLRW